ncbi:rRNA biogenesis protein rrp5 [Microbotryomycetes sp. JL201]|nr:rRNA biogenesis protein rrp5 [Microbotryomycetes sp. JL201]
MGLKHQGKTRTSSSHGPTQAKRQAKHDGAALANAKSTRSAKPSADKREPPRNSSHAQGSKRSADEVISTASAQPSRLLIAPEAIDFPRGGGTSLTQAEVREQQLAGRQEAAAVLEQEKTSRKAASGTLSSERTKNAKRRKLDAKDADAGSKQAKTEGFRVEHLNYKRLVPGTKVLGQITTVRALELIVSLPGQLLGHVPITNISPEFTQRLEQSDDEQGSENESDDDQSSRSKNDVPALADIFNPGAWISCVVTRNSSGDGRIALGGFDGDENVRTSRRVELSIEPEKVNDGVAHSDLRPGATLTAAVHSVEDHGYAMSFGLPTMASFLSFEEAAKLQKPPLEQGQVLLCRVKTISENGRTSTVSVHPTEVTNSTITHAVSVSSLLPSSLVNVLVTAVGPSGLNVKILGFFDGSIDLEHLNGRDPIQDFKIGQKLKARILWSSISDTPKRFALSVADHVLKLGLATTIDDESLTGVSIVQALPVGRIIEHVLITRINEDWGLSCDLLGDKGPIARGFVHISRISDEHLVTVPKSGPWKVGSTYKARVVGHSPLDGLVQLSLQQSILDKKFLKVSDVQVGESLTATVKRLTDSAMFLSIGGNVDGIVWPLHYSDVRLRHPERKFKPGTTVKARVFSVDTAKNRVVLTLKKQLVGSDQAIPRAPSDVRAGLVTPAVVTKVLEKALLVDLFGGTRALVPASEADQRFTSDLAQAFEPGRVILARVLSVDASGRAIASIRQAESGPSEPHQNASEVSIGSISSGKIHALHDSHIVLLLEPGRAKALMSFATLARSRGISTSQLRGDLSRGDILDQLVVVSRNEEKNIVIVGPMPDSNATENSGSAVDGWDSLTAGQLVEGKVLKVLPSAILVQVSRSVRGRVSMTELEDDFDSVRLSDFKSGRNVRCFVIAVDASNKRLELSMRRSRVEESGEAADPAIDTVAQLNEGEKIRGFVKNIAKQGVFVQLGHDVTARVQIKELFDEFVKDWESQFTIGQLVCGRIISVDKVRNQVEMSLRTAQQSKKDVRSVGNIDGLERGQIVGGTIKRIETFGVFIRLDDFDITGLCHKSKVTDDESVPWTKAVKEGDKVRALVTDVDVSSKKVSLALRRSMMPENEEGYSGPESEKEDSAESDDQDENSDDDDDENDILRLNADESETEEDDHAVESDLESAHSDDDKSQASSKAAGTTPTLSTSGFAWTESQSFPAEATKGDDDDDDDDMMQAELFATKDDKQAASTSEQLARAADGAPATAADFERLLLGEPNSSYLWIQYISFFVGLSQMDKARQIAERALKTINFRQEDEKLNVWTALLNLEHAYGDDKSLDKVFRDALQMNDAKRVYQRMLDIHARASEFEAEESLYKKFVRKFGSHPDVWTSFAQFYLRQQRPEDARALLPRSLKSLEKRDHVDTISKFAQLEFKLGDAERGRTIFEGVVESHPKRLDLWLVYVDQEIKQGNVVGVRALFERLLQQRLSSKKGKAVFKKWLSFEKEHGDEAGAAAVKDKALAFVAALSQASGEANEDE